MCLPSQMLLARTDGQAMSPTGPLRLYGVAARAGEVEWNAPDDTGAQSTLRNISRDLAQINDQ